MKKKIFAIALVALMAIPALASTASACYYPLANSSTWPAPTIHCRGYHRLEDIKGNGTKDYYCYTCGKVCR